MEKAAQVAEAGRKRKVRLDESEFSTSQFQLKTRRRSMEKPENSTSLAANSWNSMQETVCSDHSLAYCPSSNGTIELEKGSSKFVDLQEKEAAVGNFASSAGDSLDCTVRIETTQLSEVQAESGELESTARPHESSSRQLSTVEKMPSEAELEEFFAAAEKNIQKEFIDKYNYDIVNDQPLEGRYEWVQIQPDP